MPLNYLDDSNGVNPYNVLNKLYRMEYDNKISIGSGGSIVTNLWHMIGIKNNDIFEVNPSNRNALFLLP